MTHIDRNETTVPGIEYLCIMQKNHNIHSTFSKELQNRKHEILFSGDKVSIFRIRHIAQHSQTSDAEIAGTKNIMPNAISGTFCILACNAGTAEISVNYSRSTISQGAIVYLTPRMVISIASASENISITVISMKPSFFDDLEFHAQAYEQMVSYINQHTTPILTASTAENASNTENACKNIAKAAELYQTTDNHTAYADRMAIYLSNLILIYLSDALQSACKISLNKPSHKIEIYRNFKKLLTDNYEKEHYISFYADKLNISATYLSRLVRQITGRSVNDHITHMLTTEALRLIDCSDYSIKEISDMLGFADQASFGKFFKRQMKTSPSNYKKKFVL